MPTGSRPVSTLPPEPERPPADLDVFERAFAIAAAASPLGSAHPAAGAPGRGLHGLLVRFSAGVLEVLGNWLDPRCPNCAARGTVALELRAVVDGKSARLWERCYACGSTWVSVRCEDFSPWS